MDRGQAARLIACALTALAVLGTHALRASGPQPDSEVVLDALPWRIADWAGSDLEVPPRVLDQLRTDALIVREYVDPNAIPVWLLVDYHRVQRAGATVHSPRVCYPGTGWNVRSVEFDDVLGIRRDRPVCWLQLEHAPYRRLVMYWYASRWGEAAREISLKVNIVRSAFGRRPSDAAIVRVSTPIIDDDVVAARARILRFVDVAEPALDDLLPFDLATR